MSRHLIARPAAGRRPWTRRFTRSTAVAVASSLLVTGLLATTAPAATAAPAATSIPGVSAATSGALATALPGPVVVAQAPVVPGRGNTALNLFQWTWDAIAAECTSTIGPAGFAYVQTSPPQESIRGTAWWTSYQPVSYRLESKLGTRAEFKAMVDTCGAAGVKIIADTVINHMSGADVGGGTGTAGSSFGVDSFPGIYGPNDFNDCRSNISNYGDRYQVQNCRLVSLQDLRTGSDYVRTTIAAYLNDMISLGVAGFRIDAAKHIPAADLAAIKGKLTNPNVFWIHEVIGAAGEPIQPSEYLGSGDSHEFNYARSLKGQFDGKIANLRTIGESWGLLPSARAGVFVDNHDTERNGETMTYKFGAKYLLANVFMLAHPYGWPTVYSGYTFTDKDAGAPGATSTSVPDATCSSSAWTCTQRKPEIVGMVGFRAAVGDAALVNWWDNGNNTIAFGRGDKGFVVINNEASSVNRTFQTSLPAGTYCDVVAAGTCKQVTVSASGQLTAEVPAYGALAIYRGSTPPADTCAGDTTAPSVPASVTATASGTTVDVAWTASTDACTTGPVTYRVTRTGGGGAAVTVPVTGTRFAATGLAPSTAYTFTVVAVDASPRANVSAPSAGVSATTAAGPVAASTTVYYSTASGWSASYVHYKVGSGAWTTAPGLRMTAACTGWVSASVANPSGATVTAAFTNGSGGWDNNGGKDYTLSGTVAAVKGGVVTTTDPCAAVPPTGATTVYYSTASGWSASYVHYKVGAGAWTTAPGVRMTAACTGWVSASVANPSGATVTAAFTNGSGSWDNNGGKDYTLTGSAVAVKNGVVTTAPPC